MEPERDERFWFYDGSIIVQAENTLFRVHQTVLSNSSEIFSTLFSLPQSDSDTQNCIEGCPVVQLQDLAKDISDLLSSLYHPSYAFCFTLLSLYLIWCYLAISMISPLIPHSKIFSISSLESCVWARNIWYTLCAESVSLSWPVLYLLRWKTTIPERLVVNRPLNTSKAT